MGWSDTGSWYELMGTGAKAKTVNLAPVKVRGRTQESEERRQPGR